MKYLLITSADPQPETPLIVPEGCVYFTKHANGHQSVFRVADGFCMMKLTASINEHPSLQAAITAENRPHAAAAAHA